MPKTLRDVGRYIVALWHEWVPLLTGGSIIALLALWSFATGKPIPQNVAWLVVGATFIVASFCAWRQEYQLGSGREQEEERQYVEESPKVLRSLYSDYTEVAANKMARPYLKKWMRVSGDIFEVSSVGQKFAVYIQSQDRCLLSLYFDQQWTDQISLLRKAEHISVVGQIDAISSRGITLKHCGPASGYVLRPTIPASQVGSTPDPLTPPPSPESS